MHSKSNFCFNTIYIAYDVYKVAAVMHFFMCFTLYFCHVLSMQYLLCYTDNQYAAEKVCILFLRASNLILIYFNCISYILN